MSNYSSSVLFGVLLGSQIGLICGLVIFGLTEWGRQEAVKTIKKWFQLHPPESSDIHEGPCSKGGVNAKPIVPPPSSSPAGQGGKRFFKFCYDNCPYLQPTEAQQHCTREPHICKKFGERLYHAGHHPFIVASEKC